jgi:hypothetical protein
MTQPGSEAGEPRRRQFQKSHGATGRHETIPNADTPLSGSGQSNGQVC